MKRYKISLTGKLTGHGGESIAETLAALLVSALGLLILAQMVGVSAKVTQESKLLYEAYYSSDTALASSEAGASDGQAALVLKKKNPGEEDTVCAFYTDGETIRVTYRKNDNAVYVPDREKPVSYVLASFDSGP